MFAHLHSPFTLYQPTKHCVSQSLSLRVRNGTEETANDFVNVMWEKNCMFRLNFRYWLAFCLNNVSVTTRHFFIKCAKIKSIYRFTNFLLFLLFLRVHQISCSSFRVGFFLCSDKFCVANETFIDRSCFSCHWHCKY